MEEELPAIFTAKVLASFLDTSEASLAQDRYFAPWCAFHARRSARSVPPRGRSEVPRGQQGRRPGCRLTPQRQRPRWPRCSTPSGDRCTQPLTEEQKGISIMSDTTDTSQPAAPGPDDAGFWLPVDSSLDPAETHGTVVNLDQPDPLPALGGGNNLSRNSEEVLALYHNRQRRACDARAAAGVGR